MSNVQAINKTVEPNHVQDAFAAYPAATGLDLSTEIIVYIPYGDLLEYQGTRAALEAEGVIPAKTQWPEGFRDLRWEDGNYIYWLRRQRPEGAKGPRRQFLDIDWWMLRISPSQAKSHDVRYLERKKKELADIMYRQSPQGIAESNEQSKRYWITQGDQDFQDFKALIPGLIPQKRDRPPKNTEQKQ